MNTVYIISQIKQTVNIEPYRYFEVFAVLYYPDILKELRKDKGLKQKDMAEFFGIAKSTYCDFENGKRKMPLTMLDSLADLLDTSTDYILGRTAEMKPYPKRAGRKEAVIKKDGKERIKKK